MLTFSSHRKGEARQSEVREPALPNLTWYWHAFGWRSYLFKENQFLTEVNCILFLKKASQGHRLTVLTIVCMSQNENRVGENCASSAKISVYLGTWALHLLWTSFATAPPPSPKAVQPNERKIRQSCQDACMDEQRVPGKTQNQNFELKHTETGSTDR